MRTIVGFKIGMRTKKGAVSRTAPFSFQEEAMTSYWTRLLSNRSSRRRVLTATTGTALGASFLAACGGGGSDAKGGSADSGPKDASGLLSSPVDTTAKAKRGGVLKRNAT